MAAPLRMPLPWSRSCFVCGQDNPLGMRARSYVVDDRVELSFAPRNEYAGWNAVTHGGVIATVLDEVMTWAAILQSDRACFAADFSVRLRKPLPPGTEVTARARCTGSRRRIHDTEAELVAAGGEVFATASGRYMAVPADQMIDMHHDLVSTPECWPAGHIFGKPAPAGPAGKPGGTSGA